MKNTDKLPIPHNENTRYMAGIPPIAKPENLRPAHEWARLNGGPGWEEPQGPHIRPETQPAFPMTYLQDIPENDRHNVDKYIVWGDIGARARAALIRIIRDGPNKRGEYYISTYKLRSRDRIFFKGICTQCFNIRSTWVRFIQSQVDKFDKIG